MLILKINNKKEVVKKSRGIFRRRTIFEKTADVKRYSINVNGKAVTVLELTEKDLEKDDVKTLLKVYTGRVLVSENNKNNIKLKEYLFEPKEYYQRAVLSSLKNQIKTVNKEWKNICIKTDNFIPFKELFEIVKISKNVSLVTKKNKGTIKFIDDCYYEFGAIVSVKGECHPENDVFVDLEEINSSGRLMINVKGKDFLLYPDTTYFQENQEYKKLNQLGVEYNIICAAFSNK